MFEANYAASTLTVQPASIVPPFYAGSVLFVPFPFPVYPGLGQAPSYAGLHTPGLGYGQHFHSNFETICLRQLYL